MGGSLIVGFLVLKTILLSSCVSLSYYANQPENNHLSANGGSLANTVEVYRFDGDSEMKGANYISTEHIDKSKWMTGIYSTIKDKRISDLIIPGTHDSGTFGITTDKAYLVDRSFNAFYDLGLPEVHLWSRSQPGNFTAQLKSGIRYLDLRIAAIAKDGQFYWWHGITGDRIGPGLQEIADFAKMNPGEIVIVELNHFATPGNDHANTLPMNQTQKKQASDLVYKYLGPHIVPSSLGNNPTVEEIRATGKNIVAYVEDPYVASLHNDTYRNDVIINGWDGQNNPESVFNDRCDILKHFHANHSNDVTLLSSCVTPDTTNVIGGLFLAGIMPKGYFSDVQLAAIPPLNSSLELPFGSEMAKRMSFEGVAYNLLDMANKTNILGMNSRDRKVYSSIGSIHFRGTRDMIPYWLARPDVFKPNIIEVDDFINSNIVDLAILANTHQIPREVSISFQGNSRDGYVKKVFDIFYKDGDEGLHCKTILLAYTVTSPSRGVLVNMTLLQDHDILTFKEGDYPKDSNVTLFANSSGSKNWHTLYNGNILNWISTNHDIYIRGSDRSPGKGSGFAYVSQKYDDFGPKCSKGVKSGVLNYIEWNE